VLGRRSLIVVLGLALAAGCSPAGGPAATPAPPGDLTGSSAARTILANVSSTARTPQTAGAGDADDGGRGQLVLPVLNDCGNGTFATDCTVWVWSSSPHGTRAGTRSTESTVAIGTPPFLNFCASTPPGDFNAGAPFVTYGPVTFALGYNGTHSPPIVSFNTRPWVAALTNTFASTSDVAPGMTLTPTLTGAASRGWLVFFTWSWPADILLVPYAVDEIQVAAPVPPLVVPSRGSAPLGAFDCLGRPITAQREGSGFGFSPDLRTAAITSSGPELSTTVYGATASGSILLGDDRGARTVVPVTAGAATGR
jgi:hypothetical protein